MVVDNFVEEQMLCQDSLDYVDPDHLKENTPQ
jgi:hypothetical protein